MLDRRLRILAILAVLLFWVPLVAPFVQALTAVEAARAAWSGRARRATLLAAGAAAAVGFALHLATEWIWVI